MGRYSGKTDKQLDKKKKGKNRESLPTADTPLPAAAQPAFIPLQTLSEEALRSWKASGISAPFHGDKRLDYLPSHQLCSAVGYLIGIPEFRFFAGEPLCALQREVFNQLEQDPVCRVVRRLCLLRCVIMREFDNIVKRGQISIGEYLNTLNEVWPKNLTQVLYRDGCYLNPPRNNDLNQYLYDINLTVKKYLDKLNRLPQTAHVDFELVKKVILYPGATKPGSVEQVSRQYLSNRSAYPFGWYLNLDLSEFEGNILERDDDFVEMLCRQNNAPVPLLSHFRTWGRDSLETLQKFLSPHGNYHYLIFMDGENIRAEQIVPLLEQIHQENPYQVGRAVVYCPRSAREDWAACLQDAAEQIELVHLNQSIGSQNWNELAAADTAMRLLTAVDNAAILLVAPEYEYLRNLYDSETLSRKPVKILLHQTHPNELRELLKLHDSTPLSIEALLQAIPQRESPVQAARQDMARQALEHRFPLTLDKSMNLFDLVDRVLDSLPLTYTGAERIAYRTELSTRLSIAIGPKGEIKILLTPAPSEKEAVP